MKNYFSGRLIDRFMENYAILGVNSQLGNKGEVCEG
jgi:hypothetical protein